MFLKRIDNDPAIAIDKLEVPKDSEIILGRGPLMKITETKLSRKQGKIQFDTDKKCFIFTNTSKLPGFIKHDKTEQSFKSIEPNETVHLKNGTVIGILSDKYIYEVCDSDSENCDETVLNNENKENIEDQRDKTEATEDLNNDTTNDNTQEDIVENNDIDPNPGTSTSAQNRPVCQFAKMGCTRKNPQHLLDESHPGDDDYHEPIDNDDTEDQEDLPECEFGLDCYRKNPLHRKEYKHTTKPRPKRKAKMKAKKQKKAKNDEDNSDYDSSFIDDEESEMEDISNDEESVDEWEPDE